MALFSFFFTSRIINYGFGAIFVFLVSILAGLYFFQRKLIYVPNFPLGSRKEVWAPTRFGFTTYQDIYILSADGVKLHSFWIPSKQKPTNSVPTVLFFQANAGNIGHRIPILGRLSDFVDCNYFVVSYRGYGYSEGSADERGIRMDAQAALDYVLTEKRDVIDISKIVVYGQSIGGAVSIDLVARNEGKISCLIVENTFLSIPKLIPHFFPLLAWAGPLCTEKWNSQNRITEIVSGEQVPKILFLSGLQDEIVPCSHMKKLFEIAHQTKAGQNSSLIIYFDNSHHNDTCLAPGYFENIAKIIKSL